MVSGLFADIFVVLPQAGDNGAVGIGAGAVAVLLVVQEFAGVGMPWPVRASLTKSPVYTEPSDHVSVPEPWN